MDLHCATKAERLLNVFYNAEQRVYNAIYNIMEQWMTLWSHSSVCIRRGWSVIDISSLRGTVKMVSASIMVLVSCGGSAALAYWYREQVKAFFGGYLDVLIEKLAAKLSPMIVAHVQAKLDTFGTKLDAFGTEIDAYGKELDAFGRKLDAFGRKPTTDKYYNCDVTESDGSSTCVLVGPPVEPKVTTNSEIVKEDKPKADGGSSADKVNSGSSADKANSGSSADKANSGSSADKVNSGSSVNKANSGSSADKTNGGSNAGKFDGVPKQEPSKGVEHKASDGSGSIQTNGTGSMKKNKDE